MPSLLSILVAVYLTKIAVKIMKLFLTLLITCHSVNLIESACVGYDCLKEYIDKPDSNYAWKDTGIRLQGLDPLHLRRWDGYVLNFTSQAWLTPEGLHINI